MIATDCYASNILLERAKMWRSENKKEKRDNANKNNTNASKHFYRSRYVEEQMKTANPALDMFLLKINNELTHLLGFL